MSEVKHSEPEQIWLTTEQLGQRLGYTASNIRKMVGSGTAPKARKMPGREGSNPQYRFKMEDVLAWEAQLEVVDPAENARKVQAAYERIQKRG